MRIDFQKRKMGFALFNSQRARRPIHFLIIAKEHKASNNKFSRRMFFLCFAKERSIYTTTAK